MRTVCQFTIGYGFDLKPGETLGVQLGLMEEVLENDHVTEVVSLYSNVFPPRYRNKSKVDCAPPATEITYGLCHLVSQRGNLYAQNLTVLVLLLSVVTVDFGRSCRNFQSCNLSKTSGIACATNCGPE